MNPDGPRNPDAAVEAVARALANAARFESLAGTNGAWRAAARVAVAALERVRPDTQDEIHCERCGAERDLNPGDRSNDPAAAYAEEKCVGEGGHFWPDPQDERARVVGEIVEFIRGHVSMWDKINGDPRGPMLLHLADKVEREFGAPRAPEREAER
jgi:hypothetical protein